MDASGRSQGLGVVMVVLGSFLFPMIFVVTVVVANSTGDARVLLLFFIPVALLVAGLRSVKRGKQYAGTFLVAASPEEVVEKVLLWGFGAPQTTAVADDTTVTFTRRRHPIWAIAAGAAWLFVSLPVGVGFFPVGLLIFAPGGLFFLVKTTQTLTVSATPTAGGSDVSIKGEAVDALIWQLEQLMATSPPVPEQHATSNDVAAEASHA